MGTELEGNLVGELIASEVEVRTGRCETFAEAAAAMAERRRQLLELAGRLDVAPLCGTGTHPWSPWQEQRIIDTPHYRRNDELLRYVVWRNNSFGLHVHVGIRGADRAIAVMNALRSYLPELLAFSASSPFVEGVYTYLHSARTRDLHADVSALRRSRRLRRAGTATSATSVFSMTRARSPSTRRSGGACVRTSPSPRSRSVSATASRTLAEAQILAALMYALTARIARAVDEGEPLPGAPSSPDRGEPLAGDPLRPFGELHRPRQPVTCVRPAEAGGADRMGRAGRRGARSRVVSRRPGAERRGAPDRPLRGRREHRGDLCPEVLEAVRV